MRIGFFITLGIFLSIFTGINYYVGLRIKNILVSLPVNFNIKLYWTLFWFVALSYIAVRVGEGHLPEVITNLLNKIGIYWLGALFYFTMIFFAIDVLNLLNNWLGIVNITRELRDFLIYKGGAILLVTIIGLMIYGSWNAQNTKIIPYDVYIEKESPNIQELHAVMVSDIHLGNIIAGPSLSKMVDTINALEPDVILLSGDIIDGNLKPYNKHDLPSIFKKLRSKYGVFAALGNHEYYEDHPDEISQHLEDVGIKVLRDDYVEIEDSFYIVGRNDTAIKRLSGSPRKSLEEIFSTIDAAKPIILLDHNPKYMNEALENGVDLQLSGHTHKGQIFPGGIVTNSIFEIDWGHLKKENFNIIVTSGYGTWGPPIRIGTNSEIISMKIKFSH